MARDEAKAYLSENSSCAEAIEHSSFYWFVCLLSWIEIGLNRVSRVDESSRGISGIDAIPRAAFFALSHFLIS